MSPNTELSRQAGHRGDVSTSEVGQTPSTVEVLTHELKPLPEAILFTQCLQEDNLRLLNQDEDLPNLVHVGFSEALRVRNELDKFLICAHSTSPDTLTIYHITEQHDAARDAQHLARFKDHCIAGTFGARLIGDTEEVGRKRPNTHFIEAFDLDDFESSSLNSELKEMLEGRDLSGVRVGIVGTWTDVKVRMLAYGLIYRYGAKEIATCSSLTASRSIVKHFEALEDLEQIHGVKVFHSPFKFQEWLTPNMSQPVLIGSKKEIVFTDNKQPDWTDHRAGLREVLLNCLNDEKHVELSSLGGGFSGAQVFRARSGERLTVIKIGETAETGEEYFNNTRVARTLAGYVPRVLVRKECGSLAAFEMEIANTLDPAIKGPVTFQSLAQGNLTDQRINMLVEALRDALYNGMARLYRGGDKDNVNLLEAFGFLDRYGNCPFSQSVVGKIADIMGAESEGFGDFLMKNLLSRQDLAPTMDLAKFYTEWLPGKTKMVESLLSLVHGDLNLQNILMAYRPDQEKLENTWIIDFARLSRMPIITDFAKIENDLSYIVLPVTDAEQFMRAASLQRLRLSSETLELPEEFLSWGTSNTERCYVRLIKELRAIVAEIDDRGREGMEDYRYALLRYGAHTLGFNEPNIEQRRLALLGCSQLARSIVDSH